MRSKASAKSMARQKAIGARVRYIREQHGLSLADICKRLDPPLGSRMTLVRWETGENAISLDRLEQLASILRVNPGDLLGY